MVLYGLVWSCTVILVLYGLLLSCIVVFGIARFYVTAWFFMVFFVFIRSLILGKNKSF